MTHHHENTDFDRLFGEKLGAAPVGPVAGWDALSQRLDASVGVDRIVSDRIANEHTVGAPSGWPALAARLELIGRRRELLACLAIVEVALVTSALLLFARFGEVATPTPELALNEGFRIERPVVREEPIPGRDFPSAAPDPDVRSTDGRTSTTSVVPLFVPDLPTIDAPAELDLPTVQRPESHRGVPTVDPNAPQSARTKPNPPLALPPVVDPNAGRLYLTGFVSPLDINPVRTPNIYYGYEKIEEDDRLTYGKSAGLFLGVQRRRHALEFGLIYASKSYIPTPLRWNQRENGEYPSEPYQGGFDRFRFDIVSIPLNLNRNLFSSDQWRISAQYGLALNLVVNSRFEAEPDMVLTYERIADRFSALPQDERDLTYSSGRSGSDGEGVSDHINSLVDPEPGILQGGSLRSNGRLEITGGVRIERLVSDRFSVYVSPTFGRTIYLNPESGIGPYYDLLHTYNLRIGSRFNLGKR